MELDMILLHINRFLLPALGVLIVAGCVLWLLRRRTHSPPEAYLLNTINHDKLLLARYENSVGRSKHCDIVLNYPSVSRFHAVVARRKNGWVVVDTGSRTGTKINQKPLERSTKIDHGQVVAFGTFEFMFYDQEEEAKGATY